MKNKTITFFIFLCTYLLFTPISYADNPVIKDRFSADPAALVHDDKVYLYTGHDEANTNGDFFVLREWNVFSSSDLENWELEGTLPRTEFKWARGDSAWASQAIERDGKFYWYVTVFNGYPNDPGYAIGVAQSDHPAEGFTDALDGPLVSPSMTEGPEFMGSEPWDDIDPTVFIDDDGQAYMYWGNTHLYYVKLKDNMVELDGEIHQVDIENMPGTFTEGPFIHKYNDKYYLTYAMNYPEEIGYAMSDNPEGPWEFQGKLMDTLPGSKTSHPAIIEFKDQWYFIYHTAALPTGGEFRRSVSFENFTYNPDGTIEKITPTASGISSPVYSLQLFNDENKYIRHAGVALRAGPIKGDELNFKWHIIPGLADEGSQYISFQSENKPGFFLKRKDQNIVIAKHDGTDEFMEDATFKAVSGLVNEEWSSFKAYNDEDLYLYIDEKDHLRLRPTESNEDRESATFHLIDEDGNVKKFEQASEKDSPSSNKSIMIYGVTGVILLILIGLFTFLLEKRRHRTI